MIYHTRGDHDDHYTIDAFSTNYEKIPTLFYNDAVCVVKKPDSFIHHIYVTNV